jgi:hypothetical protein
MVVMPLVLMPLASQVTRAQAVNVQWRAREQPAVGRCADCAGKAAVRIRRRRASPAACRGSAGAAAQAGGARRRAASSATRRAPGRCWALRAPPPPGARPRCSQARVSVPRPGFQGLVPQRVPQPCAVRAKGVALPCCSRAGSSPHRHCAPVHAHAETCLARMCWSCAPRHARSCRCRQPGRAHLQRACQPECAPGGAETPRAAPMAEPGHACMRGALALPPHARAPAHSTPVTAAPGNNVLLCQARGAPGDACGAVRRVPGPGAAERRVRGYARRRLPGQRAAPGAGAARRRRAVCSGARDSGLVADCIRSSASLPECT